MSTLSHLPESLLETDITRSARSLSSNSMPWWALTGIINMRSMYIRVRVGTAQVLNPGFHDDCLVGYTNCVVQ